MVLDDYFQVFLRNCKQKKLAATTINFYRMALNPFINYCEDNDKDSIKGINSRLSPHTFRYTFAKLF